MKKLIRTIFVLIFLTFATAIFAQDPPSPNDGQPLDGGNTPVGGRARISGGIAFLILFGAAYGSRKLYATFRMEEQQ
ncbi:MAG TPA: hypothetical protein VIN10_11810 [Bacteroidales bacterium]